MQRFDQMSICTQISQKFARWPQPGFRCSIEWQLFILHGFAIKKLNKTFSIVNWYKRISLRNNRWAWVHKTEYSQTKTQINVFDANIRFGRIQQYIEPYTANTQCICLQNRFPCIYIHTRYGCYLVVYRAKSVVI